MTTMTTMTATEEERRRKVEADCYEQATQYTYTDAGNAECLVDNVCINFRFHRDAGRWLRRFDDLEPYWTFDVHDRIVFRTIEAFKTKLRQAEYVHIDEAVKWYTRSLNKSRIDAALSLAATHPDVSVRQGFDIHSPVPTKEEWENREEMQSGPLIPEPEGL